MRARVGLKVSTGRAARMRQLTMPGSEPGLDDPLGEIRREIEALSRSIEDAGALLGWEEDPGDLGGGLALLPSSAPPGPPAPPVPAGHRARVLSWLQQQAGWRATGAIAAGARVRDAAVPRVLADLLASGVVEHATGPHNSKLWRAAVAAAGRGKR